MRRLIHWMDNWAMSPERIPHIFTVGATVSRRLLKWGGIESTPIHHPTTFTPAAPSRGEHFLAVGRLHAWKRFSLTIDAYRQSRAQRPLVIAGTGPDEAALRARAAGDPRIRMAGAVDEATLRDLYSRAVATIFPPINEDMGLVTFESFLSAKPILTTRDAGEPAEIVRPGQTGWIADPTPEALAERIDWLDAHPAEAAAMGERARDWVKEVTWERLVGHLLDAADDTRRKRSIRPAARSAAAAGTGEAPRAGGESEPIHLLITDNQIIDPPVGGGRLRIWELYRHLPADFVTTYVGTHDHPGPAFRDQWLAPNFREIILPLTTVHFKAHEVLRRLTGGDATVDVTIPLLLARCSPAYGRRMASLAGWADLIICSHPWMFPHLPAANGLARVYDSHNCEAAVKGDLLRRTLAGRWLARRVERTERAAVAGSALVLACGPADAAEFIRRYGADPARIIEVPNGVDCRRLTPGAEADKPALRRRLGLPEGPLAVFTGSNYEPNLQALEFLIERLAPALPGLTIVVAGGVGPLWRERHGGAQ
ncbi:MAG: glycosyltransferase, partial [bacterium]|nr:glycosyltransferase [bacterium]